MIRPIRGRGAELDRATAILSAWLEKTGPAAADSATGAVEAQASMAAAEAQARAAAAGGSQEQQGQARLKLLLIRGAGGTGKSRFCEEVLRRLAERQRMRFIQYECRKNPQWIGLLAACARAVKAPAGQDADAHWFELCAVAEKAGLSGQRHTHLLPLVHKLQSGGLETEDAEDEMALEQLEELALAALKLTSSGSGTTGIYIDDLHWLGGMEGRLTAFLRKIDWPGEIVVLSNIRHGYETPQLGALYVETETVDLQPIDPAAGMQILQDILQETEYADELPQTTHELAGGRPLLYEQLALLRAQGEDPQGSEDEAGADPGRSLLEQILLQRVQALRPAMRQLAWLVCVVGPDLPRPSLLGLYRRLMDGGMLEGLAEPTESVEAAIPMSEMLDELRPLNLRHDEVRAAVLRNIPARLRTALHLAAADELRRRLKPGSAGELDNMLALVSHLEAAGENDELHQRLCELLILMLSTGRMDGWEETLARAEASSGSDASPHLLRLRGYIALECSDFQAGRKAFEDAMALCDPERQDELCGKLAGDLAALETKAGQLPEAERHYERSVELLRRAQSNRALGVTMANIGIVLHRQGQFEKARERYEEALSIAEQTGNVRSRAAVLDYLGTLFHDLGQFELSRLRYEDAIALHESLLDFASLGRSLSDYGSLLTSMREGKKALEALQRAEEFLTRLRDDSALVHLDYNYARAYKLLGQWRKAEDLLHGAVARAEELELPALMGVSNSELGDLALERQEWRIAEEFLLKAIEVLRECGYKVYLGVALALMAIALNRQQRRGEAVASFREAEALYKEIGPAGDLDLSSALERARRELFGNEQGGQDGLRES